MSATVNVGIHSDEDSIFALCKMMHRENGIFSLNEDSVRGTIRQALNRNRSIMGVVRENGEVVACVCIVVDRFWYTNDECLSELFNFVHPDHRKSRHARDLIGFAKTASENLGLPLFIGVISNIRTRAKIGLYQRMLGAVSGAFFIHNKHLIEHKDSA